MGRSVFSHRAFPALAAVAFSVSFPAFTLAGPYAEAGIPSSSPQVAGWATGVSSLVRGPQVITSPNGDKATFGDASDATGPAAGAVDREGTLSVVSLGDGGSITLTFARPIANGAGPDFAVFENAFTAGQNVFAELGFVEVSSNGVDFFRFAAVSLTQTENQVPSYGTIDPTNVRNLAGKHVTGRGTPFDLNELLGVSPSLNVNAVSAVRVVDVVGTIDTGFTTDSRGLRVNDPYATGFSSGGFDLDAVGVLNFATTGVPEPASAAVVGVATVVAGLTRRRNAR